MNPNPRRIGLSRTQRLGIAQRLCTALSCAVGLFVLGGVAQARPTRPTLSQIPIVSLPPQHALALPEAVEESSENLPFEIIFPADRPKRNKQKKKAAISYAEYQHWLSLKAKSHDVCLRVQGGAASRVQDRDQAEFYSYSGNPQQVMSVRAERLELGSRPQLVVEDFFVSPEAGHARHAATTRVPLLKVAEVGDGLTMYAFREPQRLSLVLSAPGASMIMPNASAVRLGCGVSRVSLETSGRSGVATSFALGLPATTAPERVDDFRAWSQVPMQRAWRVSVSVSQTSRDPAPVLSLTFGDPSRPVRDALKSQMPRWTDVLGQQRASELEQKLAKRD